MDGATKDAFVLALVPNREVDVEAGEGLQRADEADDAVVHEVPVVVWYI